MALIEVTHTSIEGVVSRFWIGVDSESRSQTSRANLRDGSQMQVVYDPSPELNAMELALGKKPKLSVKFSKQVEAIGPQTKPDPGIKNARKFR